MPFTYSEVEYPAQMVVSIRRNIKVPAYHQTLPSILHQLWDHIVTHDAQITGVPIALYYGPVNEEDDGPVEICVPFSGLVPPTEIIKVRELPAHKTVQVRTFGDHNAYPKLLEMWDALGTYVQEQNLEPNWDFDMTTYEIWHEDETTAICWPIREFASGSA